MRDLSEYNLVNVIGLDGKPHDTGLLVAQDTMNIEIINAHGITKHYKFGVDYVGTFLNLNDDDLQEHVTSIIFSDMTLDIEKLGSHVNRVFDQIIKHAPETKDTLWELLSHHVLDLDNDIE